MVPLSEQRQVSLFLDSSVVYSAVISSRGGSRALLALSELGLIQIVTCPYVLHEVEESLRWKNPLALDPYRQLSRAANWLVQDDPTPPEVAQWMGIVPDPKDAPILAAAVNARPHRFVTLDVKHWIEPAHVAERSRLIIRQPGQVMEEIRQYLTEGFGRSL